MDHRLLNSASVLAQQRERLYFVCIRADLVRKRRRRQHATTAAADAADAAATAAAAAAARGADNADEAAATGGGEGAEAAEAFAFPWPELPNLHRKVKDILEPEAEVPAALTLDAHRWAKVSGSNYFAKYPTARLCDLEGTAQTIGSSYKRGWALYSQFVPPLIPAAEQANTDGAEDVAGGNRQRPRFFTPREVARLQGFPESFVLEGLDQGRLYHQLGNAVRLPASPSFSRLRGRLG